MKTTVFHWGERDGYLAALVLSPRERRREIEEVVPVPLPPKRRFVRVSENVVKRPFLID